MAVAGTGQSREIRVAGGFTHRHQLTVVRSCNVPLTYLCSTLLISV